MEGRPRGRDDQGSEPVLVAEAGADRAVLAGVWYFEHTLFPLNSGWLGVTMGLVLGAFLATVYEDYLDQNSD